MSAAHRVLTRAWAGPHRVTWKLGTRNVPEQCSPFLPRQMVGEGVLVSGGGGITELSLSPLSLAQPFTHPTSKLNPLFPGRFLVSLPLSRVSTRSFFGSLSSWVLVLNSLWFSPTSLFIPLPAFWVPVSLPGPPSLGLCSPAPVVCPLLRIPAMWVPPVSLHPIRSLLGPQVF